MTVFIFSLYKLLAFLAFYEALRTFLIEMLCHKSTLDRFLAKLTLSEGLWTSLPVLLQKFSLENFLTKLARNIHLRTLRSMLFNILPQ